MSNKKTATEDKALEAGLEAIKKQYGKDSVMFGAHAQFPQIDRISSGSLGLDLALSGGYARGRLVEVYGPESSGKTTLALHAVHEAQKSGQRAAFIDMEHALDPTYAAGIGVNLDDLIIAQPSCAEEALNVCEMLARTKAVALIVIDSVSGLVPQKEIEGDIGDQHVGLQARLMSQACRKLASVLHQTNTTLLFTNQIRMKVGVMFGNPETTSGGNALKFYASQRLDIRRKDVLKVGENKTGITSKVKVAKSKVGPPFREALVNIIFGEGIDWAGDILMLAVDRNLVEKSGAWFSYGSEQIGQGQHNATQWLKDHPEAAAQLRGAILERL